MCSRVHARNFWNLWKKIPLRFISSLPRHRGEGGTGGLPPHFSSQMISTLLLDRRVNKSCKVTKSANECDAQIAGNNISEVLTFKISRRPPSPKNPIWITYLAFDLSLRTLNSAPRAVLPERFYLVHYVTSLKRNMKQDVYSAKE